MPRQLTTIGERLARVTEEKQASYKIRQAILIAPYPGQGRVMHVQLSDPTFGDNLITRAEVMSGLELGALSVGASVTVKITRGKVRVVGLGAGPNAGGGVNLGTTPGETNPGVGLGNITGLVIPDNVYITNPGNTNVFIHGIDGGVDGRVVVIRNALSGNIVKCHIMNNSSLEPIPENRIELGSSGLFVPEGGSITLSYNGGLRNRWYPIHPIYTPLQPFVYALGTDMSMVSGGNTALAVVAGGLGGARAIPFIITAGMWFTGITLWNTDAALLRSIEWGLYLDRGDGLLYSAAAGIPWGTLSFTPVAASTRTGSTANYTTWVGPGQYWLIIRNTSAANTFGLGQVAAGGLAGNVARTSAGIASLGATVDISGWTASTAQSLVRLNGRIGVENAIF